MTSYCSKNTPYCAQSIRAVPYGLTDAHNLALMSQQIYALGPLDSKTLTSDQSIVETSSLKHEPLYNLLATGHGHVKSPRLI